MKVYSANITTDKGFQNSFTGRSNNNAVAFVNENGEYGFLPHTDENEKTYIPDEPYMPIGGRKTYNRVKDVLVFKPHTFENAIVKRGRKV